MIDDAIARMSADIKTEDNAATADPIFVVQQRRRVYGFDTGYTDDFVYLDTDNDCEEVSEAERLDRYQRHVADLEDADDIPDREDFDDDHYQKTGYQDFWDNVQPFFTRQGAEEYMRVNGHNLTTPRVYVDSAFRNSEWQAIRKFLSTYKESP